MDGQSVPDGVEECSAFEKALGEGRLGDALEHIETMKEQDRPGAQKDFATASHVFALLHWGKLQKALETAISGDTSDRIRIVLQKVCSDWKTPDLLPLPQSSGKEGTPAKGALAPTPRRICQVIVHHWSLDFQNVGIDWIARDAQCTEEEVRNSVPFLGDALATRGICISKVDKKCLWLRRISWNASVS